MKRFSYCMGASLVCGAVLTAAAVAAAVAAAGLNEITATAHTTLFVLPMLFAMLLSGNPHNFSDVAVWTGVVIQWAIVGSVAFALSLSFPPKHQKP